MESLSAVELLARIEECKKQKDIHLGAALIFDPDKDSDYREVQKYTQAQERYEKQLRQLILS
jgi:hypothetical protein